MYDLLSMIIACTTLFTGGVLLTKFIKKEIDVYNDRLKDRRKEDNRIKLQILHESLSYKKFQDTSNIRHREFITESVTDSIGAIVSGLAGTFGKEYLELALMGTVELPSHLDALNKIIDMEFDNYVVLPRIGREAKPRITNMQDTTKAVSDKIVSSLEPRFFDVFEAHGLSKGYVLSYIARQITQKVIIYSRDLQKNGE